MSTRAKARTFKIGKEPLVVVPLSEWRRIEDYLEDQEALGSYRYLRRIEKSREDFQSGKVLYPFK